jgi:NO-binding membrane sensor protein with MHYT domain
MNAVSHEPFLVALSYAISVFGSYTALQLAAAIPEGRSWGSIIGSVVGAAVALGGGAIWAMHFIGMNAAELGVPVAYDPVLTLVSLLVAIIAPAVGLFIVGRSDGGPINLPLGALLTGLGIALMHYAGMAALILPAKVSYDLSLFGASIVIAVVAATVALWLAFSLSGKLQRLGGAFIVGLAVCAMHYTGMYALKLEPTREAVADGGISLPPEYLAYSVFGIAVVLLTLLLVYGAGKSQRTLTSDL